MSVLCRDIPICLMLFFGFLYCLATPIGPSRPFKGAFWKELKAFFHDKSIFSRRNALILLGIFAISFAGYFALLRGGESYWDDISRQSSGSFGWAFSFGRIATEVLNLAIHGAFLIHDRSPLGQLAAMGFLSAAALAMALAFKGLLQTGGGQASVGSTLPAR